MTKIQNIVNDILVNLAGISVANGYSFDIKGKVYDWREIPVDPADLPVLIAQDGEIITAEGDSRHKIAVIDIIYAEASDAATVDVRRRAADVLRAFSLVEQHADVMAAGFISWEMGVDHQKRKVADINLKCQVEYYTDYWEI